jgi:predicted nucleic acid-binding protein
MIIPDANLLIYAHDESCPQHRKALEWWQRTLGGSETVGIPWIVLLAFTRLLTSPQICLNPLTVGQVREIVESWLTGPNVRMIQVSPRAVGGLFDLLQEALVHDLAGFLALGLTGSVQCRLHVCLDLMAIAPESFPSSVYCLIMPVHFKAFPS